MTAQNSRIDLYNFRPYFFYKLKSLRVYAVVQLVLAVLAYPLLTVMIRLDADTDNKYMEARNVCNALVNMSGDFSPIIGTQEYSYMLEMGERRETVNALFMFALMLAVISLIGIAIMHFVVQMKCFRWLYNKETVDMDYSLPVSADARFIADFFAGLLAAGIPHVLSVIAGTIILWGWSDFNKDFSGYEFTVTACAGLAACVLFYCFNMLIMSLCGKRSKMILMPVLANFALPMIIMSGYTVVKICGYGNAVNDVLTNMFYAAGPYSPITLVVVALTSFDTTTISMDGELIHTATPYIFRPGVIIPVLVLSVVCFAAAWLLVKKRRAENVGSSYAFRPARHVLHIGMVLTLVLVFVMLILLEVTDGYLGGGSAVLTTVLWAVVAVFVIYVALEVSVVGIKRFGFTVLRWLAVTAGCGAVTLCLMCTDGFGSGWRVPDADGVRQVYYHIDRSKADYTGESSMGDISSDPSIIQQVTELHKQVPDLRDYSNVFEGISEGWLGAGTRKLEERGHVITIQYFMKDGNTREYRYLVDSEFSQSFIKNVYARGSLLKSFESFNGGADDRTSLSANAKTITGYYYPSSGEDTITLAEGFSSQSLYDAACADIKAADPDKLSETTAGEYSEEICFLMEFVNYLDEKVAFPYSVNIYPWMTNTTALLESHGITFDFLPLADLPEGKEADVFLLKMNGVPEGASLSECGYYDKEQLSQSRIYPLSYPGKIGIYAIAGDERCASVIMSREWYEPDEVFTAPDGTEFGQPYGWYQSQAAYLSAAQVERDSPEYEELVSLGGSAVSLNHDLTKDAYILMFSCHDADAPAEEWILDDENGVTYIFITEDNAPRAAELFEKLTG